MSIKTRRIPRIYSSRFLLSSAIDTDYGDITQWQCNNTAISGKVRLDKYIGTDTSVFVPKLNGKTILKDMGRMFLYDTKVLHVDFQHVPVEGGKMWQAFDSSNIRTVTNLNSQITNMVQTFQGCGYFNCSFKIPESVQLLEGTFSGCSRLNVSLEIPNSVTSLGSTFAYCSNLNVPITIPNTVTDMQKTFMNCSSLNLSVNIPNSAVTLRETFRNCKSLNTPITIPNSVTNMMETFRNCTAFCSTVTIYSTEISIGKDMFRDTSNSKEVHIYYQYANGVNSRTYNTLASLDGQCGVTLVNMGRAPW